MFVQLWEVQHIFVNFEQFSNLWGMDEKWCRISAFNCILEGRWSVIWCRSNFFYVFTDSEWLEVLLWKIWNIQTVNVCLCWPIKFGCFSFKRSYCLFTLSLTDFLSFSLAAFFATLFNFSELLCEETLLANDWKVCHLVLHDCSISESNGTWH